jgi:hypothetical protein
MRSPLRHFPLYRLVKQSQVEVSPHTVSHIRECRDSYTHSKSVHQVGLVSFTPQPFYPPMRGFPVPLK